MFLHCFGRKIGKTVYRGEHPEQGFQAGIIIAHFRQFIMKYIRQFKRMYHNFRFRNILGRFQKSGWCKDQEQPIGSDRRVAFDGYHIFVNTLPVRLEPEVYRNGKPAF